MAQFKIRLSNAETKYPNEMEKADKEILYFRCQKENLKLFCGCNGRCEYGIRKNTWAIYPLSMKEKHEDWCPKSDLYRAKSVYNSGFKIDEESGDVKVCLSEPIEKETIKGNIGIDNKGESIVHSPNSDREYPKHQQGEITISAMIKKMNMMTFKHVAYYKKDEQDILYPNADRMCQKIFWAEKRVKIGKRRKSIADFNKTKDNCAFVYEMLSAIPEYTENDEIIRLQTSKKMKDDSFLTVPVYKEALERAIIEYENTYSTRDMKNRNIVLTGFRDRWAMYNLRFLLVNDFGLFSESLCEVKMYNEICNIFNSYKLKEKGVFFYKPFEYGYGAYEDKYLEDGIIEFEKSNKKIIIEVYGRKDADYLRKKEIKSKILESNNNIYHYVPWNAYLNEALPVKEIKAEIDKILSEIEHQQKQVSDES